jgi:hypothetical protein
MSALDGLIETYEMRTGNTTKAAREELTKLRSDLEKANIAIDEVKIILADCPFESWWKVGLWMEKYGVHAEEKP